MSKDPFLAHIFGLLAAGLTCTGFSITGYLHQPETMKLLGTQLTYQAAYRKLPLSLLGTGFAISSWLLVQERREWKQQYRQWQRQQQFLQQQREVITHQAELEGHHQLARLQAAERLYPQMQPYLDAEYQEMEPLPQPTTPQPMVSPPSHQEPANTHPTTPPASPTIATPTKRFPEEDLAAQLAKTTQDPSTAGSTLIACPKGTGKSNLLRAAISSAHQLHQGRAEFVVMAGKDDETYCGLELDPKAYLYSGDMHHAPETFDRMALYQSRLKRSAGYPTIFVLDEYNNTLEAARMFDRLNNAKPRKELLIGSLTYERITKGRSKLVCDWMTSHEPDVEAIGLSLSLQQSLNFVVLARGNKFGAIHAALKAQRPIVDDDLIREKLRDEFSQYRQENSADFNTVIALTNLMGDWRLVTLPRYPDIQPTIRAFGNPSTPHVNPIPQQEIPNQPPQNKDQFLSQIKTWLNDCWQADQTEFDVGQLPEPLQRCVEISQKVGWINATYLRQNVRFFKDQKDSISPDQIRHYFYQLIQRGLGQVDGEGSSLRWCLEPQKWVDGEGV